MYKIKNIKILGKEVLDRINEKYRIGKDWNKFVIVLEDRYCEIPRASSGIDLILCYDFDRNFTEFYIKFAYTSVVGLYSSGYESPPWIYMKLIYNEGSINAEAYFDVLEAFAEWSYLRGLIRDKYGIDEAVRREWEIWNLAVNRTFGRFISTLLKLSKYVLKNDLLIAIEVIKKMLREEHEFVKYIRQLGPFGVWKRFS